ncbi:MAG: hypothetical protein LKM30_05475 [Bacilli bacterium]|jgi:hypothetical protein|nr:hypothetical protein [Bacilli bacterium]
MDILFSLLICIALNLVISTIMSILIPNYILAAMATSIIIAFIYAIFSVPNDRAHFYKQKYFWLYFFGMSILFLVIDAFSFLF